MGHGATKKNWPPRALLENIEATKKFGPDSRRHWHSQVSDRDLNRGLSTGVHIAPRDATIISLQDCELGVGSTRRPDLQSSVRSGADTISWFQSYALKSLMVGFLWFWRIGRKWVMHIKEWSLKQVAMLMTLKMRKVAVHIPNLMRYAVYLQSICDRMRGKKKKVIRRHDVTIFTPSSTFMTFADVSMKKSANRMTMSSFKE